MLFPHQRLGKKAGAAFYFSWSIKGVMVAGGMYLGETRELQAVRERLAEKHSELRSILNRGAISQSFGELQGKSLQRSPKQFGVDHPAADLLRRKQWLLSTSCPAERAMTREFAVDAVKAFRLLIPFVKFLNEALGRQTIGGAIVSGEVMKNRGQLSR